VRPGFALGIFVTKFALSGEEISYDGYCSQE